MGRWGTQDPGEKPQGITVPWERQQSGHLPLGAGAGRDSEAVDSGLDEAHLLADEIEAGKVGGKDSEENDHEGMDSLDLEDLGDKAQAEEDVEAEQGAAHGDQANGLDQVVFNHWKELRGGRVGGVLGSHVEHHDGDHADDHQGAERDHLGQEAGLERFSDRGFSYKGCLLYTSDAADE